MLISYAAHGLATSSLEGMGEITLRDGLVVAAASIGAKNKRAWILEREVLPAGWSDAAVDLVVNRKGNNDSVHMVGGVELKWWRQTDKGNAGNRRKELIKDFIRAAALYNAVEDFAFVALLSTSGSWSQTASTQQTDKEPMKLLEKDGVQKWNLERMKKSSSIRAALKSLDGRVAPISKIFHTELLSYKSINDSSTVGAFAKVWSVRRPQKTTTLDSAAIAKLTTHTKKRANQARVATA